MITTLIAIAIAWPRETWEVHDRVIFRTRVIHQPQLFGFGNQATTRRELTMIFQRRLRFGHWETTEERDVERFPEWERCGTGLRFCWLQRRWDEDGDDYSVWRRCHARELWEIETVEYRRPE